MIGSSFILGLSIGSILGGKFVSYGRRKVLIIVNILCAFSVIPTLFLNLWSICVGRFLYGLFSGMFLVLGPKMLDENIPSYLLGIFGTASVLGD